MKLEDYFPKRYTWFWLGSYQKNKQKVKIEVSKRVWPDEYVHQNFFGISVKTLAPEYMFAHKLCAITDRKKLQNRDLFDAWYMFDRGWNANEEIIQLRTGKSKKQYFSYLSEFIDRETDKQNLLDGLGEVLVEAQKNWVKNHLIDSLLFELKIRS